jgi:hypothetical protein
MAILVPTVQIESSDGITPTFGAANADGYAVPADGRTVLEVKNAGVETIVTIDNPVTNDSLAYADKAVTVIASSGDKRILIKSLYAQLTGTWAHYALVTFTSVSGVTVGWFRTP